MAFSPGTLIYPKPAGFLEGLSGPDFVALAIRAQDAYTQGHGLRVAAYAGRIAQRLRLDEAEAEAIRLGGLLHDIGKVAFSRSILNNRDARLSESMRAEIRRHPVIGADFLRAIHVAPPVIDCVRFHHERLDGSGYPDGLRGSQIPVGAAVIGVADSFDALTTDRLYQKGRSLSRALEILLDLRGTAFDPQIVQALVEEHRARDPEYPA